MCNKGEEEKEQVLIDCVSYLFRIGGTEFNELEFIVMFIPVSETNEKMIKLPLKSANRKMCVVRTVII